MILNNILSCDDIDMSLSKFAWVMVVIFQAAVHYGVIGPGRYNSRNNMKNYNYNDREEYFSQHHQMNESNDRI